jgi:hypothetical protein
MYWLPMGLTCLEENGFWMQWLEGGQTEVKTDGAPRLSGRGM